MKLAIGIKFEEGSTWSIGTDSTDPQEVANALAKHNGNGTPDEILLVENNANIGNWNYVSPEVCEHWNLGKHYENNL